MISRVVSPNPESCDACRSIIEPGVAYVDGISSCCGACQRILCALCVARSAQLLRPPASESGKVSA